MCAYAVAVVLLDCREHICQSGTNHQDPEAAEEPCEAVPLQTLHQHAHLRRHRSVCPAPALGPPIPAYKELLFTCTFCGLVQWEANVLFKIVFVNLVISPVR